MSAWFQTVDCQLVKYCIGKKFGENVKNQFGEIKSGKTLKY